MLIQRALFGKARHEEILWDFLGSCLLLALALAPGLGDFTKAPRWGPDCLFQISALTTGNLLIPLPLFSGLATVFVFLHWFQIAFCLVMGLLFAVDTGLYVSVQRDLPRSVGDWRNCKERWSQGSENKWGLGQGDSNHPCDRWSSELDVNRPHLRWAPEDQGTVTAHLAWQGLLLWQMCFHSP